MDKLEPFVCNNFCDFCVRQFCPKRPVPDTKTTNELQAINVNKLQPIK